MLTPPPPSLYLCHLSSSLSPSVQRLTGKVISDRRMWREERGERERRERVVSLQVQRLKGKVISDQQLLTTTLVPIPPHTPLMQLILTTLVPPRPSHTPQQLTTLAPCPPPYPSLAAPPHHPRPPPLPYPSLTLSRSVLFCHPPFLLAPVPGTPGPLLPVSPIPVRGTAEREAHARPTTSPPPARSLICSALVCHPVSSPLPTFFFYLPPPRPFPRYGPNSSMHLPTPPICT